MEFILKKEPHTTLWTEKIALLHSEKGKLLATQSIPKMQSLNTHTHTFAYLWVSHRGSCIALHQPTSFIVKRVPFICHLHASLEDVSGEHETCLVIIRHLSWLQDKRRLKEMYSPCQLWIRLSFHTEQGKIAPHINFSVCCQQGLLLYTHAHTPKRITSTEYCLSLFRQRKSQIHALEGAPDVNCVFSFHIHIHTHTQTYWSVACQLLILPFLIPKKERSCQLSLLHLFIPKKSTAITHINSSVWCPQCNTGFLHTEKIKIEHEHFYEHLMPTIY